MYEVNSKSKSSWTVFSQDIHQISDKINNKHVIQPQDWSSEPSASISKF